MDSQVVSLASGWPMNHRCEARHRGLALSAVLRGLLLSPDASHRASDDHGRLVYLGLGRARQRRQWVSARIAEGESTDEIAMEAESLRYRLLGDRDVAEECRRET